MPEAEESTEWIRKLVVKANALAHQPLVTGSNDDIDRSLLEHRAILLQLIEADRAPDVSDVAIEPEHVDRSRTNCFGVEGVDFEYGDVEELDPEQWRIPPFSVPIHADVVTYDWKRLYKHSQFDVIMMDPPWQLAGANPTRGVALGYDQLTDRHIADLPIPQLQSDGLLFVWVINAKYSLCLDLFDKWGYRLVDEIIWVKMTINRRLAKSHGFYLQHAKEVCLVGKRGLGPRGLKAGVASDVLFSERRGQSQKPEEIYDLIEEMVPQGKYLEIFARKNNLRDWWVSVGNEVTGQGLPVSVEPPEKLVKPTSIRKRPRSLSS